MFQHSEFNSIPEFRGRLAWGSTLGCQETSKVEVPLLHIHQRCRISLFFEFSILGERFHPGALWNHFQFFWLSRLLHHEERTKRQSLEYLVELCTVHYSIWNCLIAPAEKRPFKVASLGSCTEQPPSCSAVNEGSGRAIGMPRTTSSTAERLALPQSGSL